MACIKLDPKGKVLGRMVHCPILKQGLQVRRERGEGEAWRDRANLGLWKNDRKPAKKSWTGSGWDIPLGVVAVPPFLGTAATNTGSSRSLRSHNAVR